RQYRLPQPCCNQASHAGDRWPPLGLLLRRRRRVPGDDVVVNVMGRDVLGEIGIDRHRPEASDGEGDWHVPPEDLLDLLEQIVAPAGIELHVQALDETIELCRAPS